MFNWIKRKIREVKRDKNKLSENFSKTEWDCKCGCGQCYVNWDLIDMMQTARNIIGLPIVIHCVNRCIEHNAKQPGASVTSKHLTGEGADWHVKGWTLEQLHSFVKENWGEGKLFYGGMKCYPWGVHTDVGRLRTW